ncbi:MFS transporter [Ruegeria pomeroyi]|uniref:MFS transporter n=1 Tax=Ruegeria pomeroyi TaxID=89184 RepID=A0A9Q3WHS8_9RHOB|nr:MFS transporter [Ruegeria pomeroyi]MCE8519156.1 MFS transporter [Ruegeria pomeroyi]MCE8523413.1 MFS transporter [Ruegeria pomeroyi]MCE8527476.1 MFS transporter [Ruegeria pomeroyi]MCE8534210.1 MFS transporter [Ruegeria pomeroyi]MCE8540036.1 MFS transporter [Ruegeria pomeroyi]
MDRSARLINPILIVSCIIITVSFAVRASFGVFQIPIAEEFGWLRSDFSLAIAIQNLAWGIGQPIFGAISEKIGDRKAIFLGALLYAGGMVLSAWSTTPLEHQIYAWAVGFGIAGTGFGVILAVVARASSDDNRSMSLALITAAGSVGQVIGAPTAEWLLTFLPWQQVFIVFAVAVLALVLTLPMLRAPEPASKAELQESMGQILSRAFRDPSYTLIFLGFFSCGYQLSFITAHFPAFVTEMCGPILPGGVLHSMGITTTSALGAVAISLVGLANIAGTLTAGWAGKHFPKKYLLAGIYTARTVIGAAFILLPITPLSVILFSVAMGSLWLATVPLTSGLVAHLYGLRYMGTLYGIIFLSHQLGGFLGVWLGGRMYDLYGDYTMVWWIGVGVGAFSAIVHLPIRENRAPVPA